MSGTINRTGRKCSNGKTALGYVILIAVLMSGCSDESGSEIGTATDYSTWMTDQIDVIGEHTLREISIPGSHDAGMNGKTHCWPAGSARDCNTQTQESSIYEQLSNGARYFDIRPTRWGGVVMTHGMPDISNTRTWGGWDVQDNHSTPSLVM